MTRIECILIILLINIAMGTSKQCKYANCPDGTQHTMCLYSAKSLGAKCGQSKHEFLGNKEKIEILKMHNNFRAKVADGKELRGRDGKQPAGIIKPLKWSEELALIAQTWANQCEGGHDKCIDVDGIQIGQNTGLLSNYPRTKFEFLVIVTMWYNEVTNITRGNILNFKEQDTPLIGHYTQLIWADTTHVGCGGIKFMSHNNRMVYLVCNYSPGGNMVDEAAYKFLE